MNNLRLVNIKSEFFIISDEALSPGDWLCDRNGYYEAPEIDGFIGFRKIVATTKKLKLSNCEGFIPMILLKNLLSFIGKLPKEGHSSSIEIETVKRNSFFSFFDKKHAKKEFLKLRSGYVRILKIGNY